jgi:hypothetical protein
VGKKKQVKESRVVGFLGVGLDNDGEQRVTRSEHFFLVGGSKDTHEKMQDTAIKFSEEIKKRGKPLPETPIEEVIEILYESQQ